MRSPASASTAVLRRGGSLASFAEPSTAPDRTRESERSSRGDRPQLLDEPIGASAKRFEVERLGGRAVGRSPEQEALAGGDPERAHDVELVRRLDALCHDERAPSICEVAQRPDDFERSRVVGATLDEREVDLDDVEPQLTQQPKAC